MYDLEDILNLERKNYIQEAIDIFKLDDIDNYNMYKNNNLSDEDIFKIITSDVLKDLYFNKE